MEVASGTHRFGSRFVNWYVAEQAGVLLPGQVSRGAMGWPPAVPRPE
jgi:hypothetical protein